MLEGIELVRPEEIEKRSMQIIESEMSPERAAAYSPSELKIVKRCIHTSADFDYQYNTVFLRNAADTGMKAIKNGAHIITDTQMAASGINKNKLAEYGCSLSCFMGEPDVMKEAKERGVTRASICMEKAAKLSGKAPVIIAVGNAPTALIRLRELTDEGFRPALIIAAPVGFVNIIESKRLIKESDIPAIVADGRKGGSNIAACIVNALLYQIEEIKTDKGIGEA